MVILLSGCQSTTTSESSGIVSKLGIEQKAENNDLSTDEKYFYAVRLIESKFEGSVDRAIVILTELAEEGHVWSQYFLGLVYANGIVTDKDEKLGLTWISKAAEQGYPSALMDLANCYFNGIGVEQSYVKAFQIYERLATSDERFLVYPEEFIVFKDVQSEAKRSLAFLHEKGLGCEIDQEKALELYHLSSSEGNVWAALYLAEVYAEGRGVQQDMDRVNDYLDTYENAIARNIKRTFFPGGVELEFAGSGEFLDASVNASLSNIREYFAFRFLDESDALFDQEKGLSWLRMAVDSGSQSAAFYLGLMLYREELVPLGAEDVADLFLFASNGNVTAAHCAAAVLSERGEDPATIRKLLEHSAAAGVYVSDKALKSMDTLRVVDFQQSVDEMKQDAEQGDPNAEYYMALSYLRGYSALPEQEDPIAWMEKAANNGSVTAQFYLGENYLYGRRTSIDYNKAFYWYNKAKDNGYADAVFKLAYMYGNPNCGRLDHEKAIELYKSSVNTSFANLAYYNIALKYDNGEGVEKDLEKAVYYYGKSAELGDALANRKLGLILIHEKSIQDPKRGIEHLKEAGERGDALSLRYLGTFYREGKIVERSPVKSYEYFSRGAALGDDFSNRAKALSLIHGVGAEKDMNAAYSIMLNLANKTDTWRDWRFLAKSILLKEDWSGYDPSEGIRIIRKYADQGVVYCMLDLASYLVSGKHGLEINPSAAFMLREKAYKNSSGDLIEALSSHALGECYERGIGVEKNLGRAIALYIESAKMNTQEAVMRLSYLFSTNRLNELSVRDQNKMLFQAANIGIPGAWIKIANDYLNGLQVDYPPETIEAKIKLLVERENSAAAEILAKLRKEQAEDRKTKDSDRWSIKGMYRLL